MATASKPKPESKVENRRVELAVLAFAVTWPEKFYEVVDLRDEHYLDPGVRRAMGVMRSSYLQQGVGSIQAMPLIVSRLVEGGMTEPDAMTVLTEAMDYQPKAPEAIEGLRTVLVDASTRRAIRSLGERLGPMADRPGASADELIQDAAKALSDAVGKGQMVRVASMHEVMQQDLDRMERIAAGEPPERGLSSGMYALDAIVRFRPGQLIIVGGRPGSGKSALVGQFLYSLVVQQGIPGVVFSLEMVKEEYSKRCVCQIGHVDIQHAMDEALSPGEMERYRAASKEWRSAQADWFIDDAGGTKIHRLTSTVRRLYNERGIRWAAVDYLQLMDHDERQGETKASAIGRTSAALKALALDLKIPVIALAQLNRDLENRENKRPRLSDLRESGNLEQDADVAIFIYRENEHLPADQRSAAEGQEYEQAELIVAKQRNGPKGTAKVAFYRHCARFTDWPEIGQYGP